MNPPTRLLHPEVRARAAALSDAVSSASAMLSQTMNSINELFSQITLQPTTEAACKAEIERLEERLKKQQERGRHLSNLEATIRAYLEAVPANVHIEAVTRPRVKPNKGETPVQAVERLRVRINELLTERDRVLRSDLPIKFKKLAAKAYVDALANQGTPFILASHAEFKVVFSPNAFTNMVDAPAILAWLDPEALLDRLCDTLDATPKTGRLELSPDAKQDKLADIAGELERLETEECALIELALDEGTEILPRINITPPIFLGVRIVKRRAAA